jgi:ribosomal protein L35
MPKMKTHSGSKKRFRKKSPGRKRRFKRPSKISKADRERVNTLLAGGGR